MALLIEVQDLRVAYTARTGQRSQVLAGVSFAVEQGEILGVLGESGSGKSTLAAALLRMLSANGEIQGGSVWFEGRDLLQAKPSQLESIRGRHIALIFQEPSLALHPTLRVREQITGVIAAHQTLKGRAAQERARQILATVFPSESERIADAYPHELSGGQRARVLIAQAISCEPSLIVADEPTASLDPETQQEILSLFRTLRQRFNLSMIWITHNPLLLAGFADRVLVLYAGRVAESGPTESVLFSPRHPYTSALLHCLPVGWGAASSSHKAHLPVISGEVPTAKSIGNGCCFEPRCTERLEICKTREPELFRMNGEHEVSCFKHAG